MDSSPFLRTEMLLGKQATERLARARVAVFGLGGVGSYAVEVLARSGVGALTLIDQDTVGESNLNRQLIALRSTLGMPKAEAAAQRVLDINPACAVTPLLYRYEPESKSRFWDSGDYNYIVDAIDLVSCKLDLIETALDRGVPIISALGTGNKLDPTRFVVTDISKTSGCPLARVIRRELKSRGILHHKVVFSPEEAITPAPTDEAPPPGRRSIPGSVPWVPAAAGRLLGSAVVRDLSGV